jgi:signal transduction histidine kinase
MAPVPWPAFASLAAGLGTLALVAYLWRYRGKPGADWFLLSLGFQTVWALAYGVALLTTTPGLRWALEVVVWAGMAGTAIYFLAFALAYTGRGHSLRTWPMRALLAAPLVTGPFVAANPVHHLTWTNYYLDAVGGMATVSYAIQPWTLAGMTVGVLFVVVGSLLLFDTVVSYGPLYRREAVAVGLSTVPVSVALLVWLYGVGPVPQLNFAPVMFVPHVALDAYAFAGSDMFEFHPATRRAGERAAIDDLGTPVVIVDEQARVVTLNDTACERFAVDKQGALTRPLADLLGTAVDPADPTDTVDRRGPGGRRVYAVTSTPLSDAADTHVGYTVVLQDVTEERRREQRLNVLNRVLRHNLRNDMDVVRGFAAAASDAVADDAASEYLDTIETKTADLLALGEKARDVERMLDRDGAVTNVDLATLAARTTADTGHPDAVSVEVDETTIRTDPETLGIVLASLVENAIEHAGSPGQVTITAESTPDAVLLRVSDDGPGIPDHELAVLDAGAESALEHGSGLGLWLANWGATTLGGSLTFDADDDGTTATVRLPRADESTAA